MVDIKTSLLAAWMFLAVGCAQWSSPAKVIDLKSFQWTGTTLLAKSEVLTLREVLLATDANMDKSIVIEGSVVQKGRHGTYFVVSDQTARLLVSITNLIGAESEIALKGGVLRILGRVEQGKKGTPYFVAEALRPGAKRVE